MRHTLWCYITRSRPNDLENIGQGQRSLHATHPLMVVIICGKCGNNRSRTENITEWTRFSKSRLNDFEDIGHCQGSLYATHPLILMIICAKYDKNPSVREKLSVSPDIVTDIFLLIVRHLMKSSDILTIGKEWHLMKYLLYLSCIICKYNETHSHLTGIYYSNRK